MRVLRELRAELVGFLQGQAHGLCVLRGERDYIPFVYRLLQELEDTSPDVFLCFPQTFTSADDYAELVVGRIEASGQQARREPGWTLAPRCSDRSHPPAERVITALEGARAMLRRGSETPRLVVVLCPLTISDEAGHLNLTRALALREPGAPPWFHRMRVVVHAPGCDPWPLPRLARALAVDLSPAKLAAAADADAADPTMSREQRAHALLETAHLDLGHRRFDAARGKLDRVFGEAQALQSPVLRALALSGLGDVERVAGADAAAIAWYERSLIPAGEARSPVLLLTVTRHLADLYFKAGRTSDAETFYDGAQQLAAVLPDPESQATALLGRALAQQRRGAGPGEWAASLAAAATIARDNDRTALLADLRPRLAASRNHPLPPELRRTIEGLLGGGA